MSGDIDLPYWKKALDDRNRPWTDEELDQILPSQGYEIVKPPESYADKYLQNMPASQLVSAESAMTMSTGGYSMPGSAQSDLIKA